MALAHAIAEGQRAVREQHGAELARSSDWVIRTTITAAAPVIEAAAKAAAAQAIGGEQDEFLEEILRNTPEGFDTDDAAESIAVDYVRWLEAEVGHYRDLAGDVLGQFELSGLRYRAAVGKILMARWRKSLRGER